MRFATFISTAAALVSLTSAVSLDTSANGGGSGAQADATTGNILTDTLNGVTNTVTSTVDGLTDALGSGIIAGLGVVSDKANECGTELPCVLAQAAADSANEPSSTVPAVVPRSWTNAQRFARGLPPKPPHRRSAARRHAAAPVPSGTPSQTLKGHIQVNRADNGETLGYVSASTIGKYGYRYQPIESALVVSVSLPVGATTGTELELKVENSDIEKFEYWGAIQGRDNLSSDFSKGSYQYAYLSSTNPTDPLSAPQTVGNAYSTVSGLSRTSESAIWTLDASGALTPKWINSDNSAPAVDIFTQSTALYIGGDSGSFTARYPSPVIQLTLKFVAI
jgi:hypothetical protein